MYELKDLIEFDSPDLQKVIGGVLSKEMIYFSSFSTIVSMAELAYRMQLPYSSFWKSMTNLVLLNYHEMEISHVIQILYYLQKMGHTELKFEHEFLSPQLLKKAERLDYIAS
jgi:hypothetical protein